MFGGSQIKKFHCVGTNDFLTLISKYLLGKMKEMCIMEI